MTAKNHRIASGKRATAGNRRDRSSKAKKPVRGSRGRAQPIDENKSHETAERLQKVMAAAGVGSRRMCEELITAGRVEVDRQVVRRLGTTVDPNTQEIRLDGAPINARRKVYFLVNKPSGILSTSRDPAGRPRVIDLLPPHLGRLFTVGRLDKSSEGLILVTNDGELADRLTHPRYGVEKTYHVLVAGLPTRESLNQLRRGVHLAEGHSKVQRLRVKTTFKNSTLLEMVLSEGRNREIRRLLARIGHKVLKLKRVAIGPVRLKELPPGEFRRLTGAELKGLRGTRRPAKAKHNARAEANVATSDITGPRKSRRGTTPSAGRPGAGGKKQRTEVRSTKKSGAPRHRPSRGTGRHSGASQGKRS